MKPPYAPLVAVALAVAVGSALPLGASAAGTPSNAVPAPSYTFGQNPHTSDPLDALNADTLNPPHLLAQADTDTFAQISAGESFPAGDEVVSSGRTGVFVGAGITGREHFFGANVGVGVMLEAGVYVRAQYGGIVSNYTGRGTYRAFVSAGGEVSPGYFVGGGIGRELAFNERTERDAITWGKTLLMVENLWYDGDRTIHSAAITTPVDHEPFSLRTITLGALGIGGMYSYAYVF